MYRCEIPSQHNKNQCHSSYRFWIIWLLPRLHVKKKFRFRWIGILCGLHNNLERMKAVLFVLAYPIEDWIVNKTAYQSHLRSLLFMRYCTFKMHGASKKIVFTVFFLNIQSMDCNRVVEVRGSQEISALNFFLFCSTFVHCCIMVTQQWIHTGAGA